MHVANVLLVKEESSSMQVPSQPYSSIRNQGLRMLKSSQVALVVKNPPENAGYIRGAGSIPGLGRSPGVGPGNPLQYSCLEDPWTEEPGGLQTTGSQRVRRDWSDLARTHTCGYCLSKSRSCRARLIIQAPGHCVCRSGWTTGTTLLLKFSWENPHHNHKSCSFIADICL